MNVLIKRTTKVIFAVLFLALIFNYGCLNQEKQTKENRWIAQSGMVIESNASAIVISAPNCTACDFADYVLMIVDREAPGIAPTEIERLDHASPKARALISRYKIEKLPVVILQKETEWDPRMLSLWSAQFGTLEDDNSLILRDIYPPYYDLKSGQLKGFVTIKLIVNKSCTECYDVDSFTNDMISVFKFIATKKEIDIESDEGKQFVAQYHIDKIPTFALSSDAAEYPGFNDFWLSKNNTIESDGWFVFRAVDQLGAYYIKLE